MNLIEGKTLAESHLEEIRKLCSNFLSSRRALTDKVIIYVTYDPIYFCFQFDFSCETVDEDVNGDSVIQRTRRIVDCMQIESVQNDLPKFIEHICSKAISDLFFYIYVPSPKI